MPCIRFPSRLELTLGRAGGAKPGSSLSIGDGAGVLCKPQIPKPPWDHGGSLGHVTPHVFGHWGADTLFDWEPRFTLRPTQKVEAAASHARHGVRSQIASAETQGAGIEVLADIFANKATATLKLRQRSMAQRKHGRFWTC
eukprot:2804146-Amphidinium_carterae.1